GQLRWQVARAGVHGPGWREVGGQAAAGQLVEAPGVGEAAQVVLGQGAGGGGGGRGGARRGRGGRPRWAGCARPALWWRRRPPPGRRGRRRRSGPPGARGGGGG